MQMISNRHARPALAGDAGAVVIDFAAERALRQEARMYRAAQLAAAALACVERGRADWTALAAALVAPFNS